MATYTYRIDAQKIKTAIEQHGVFRLGSSKTRCTASGINSPS